MVSPGVSHPQKTRGGCLDLVGEGCRGEACLSRHGTWGSCKHQHSPQAGVPGGYGTHNTRVFNDNNGVSCQQKLLPGCLQIFYIDAISFPPADVLFHLGVKISATQVGSCCKKFEDIHHLPDIEAYGPCEISL